MKIKNVWNHHLVVFLCVSRIFQGVIFKSDWHKCTKQTLVHPAQTRHLPWQLTKNIYLWSCQLGKKDDGTFGSLNFLGLLCFISPTFSCWLSSNLSSWRDSTCIVATEQPEISIWRVQKDLAGIGFHKGRYHLSATQWHLWVIWMLTSDRNSGRWRFTETS